MISPLPCQRTRQYTGLLMHDECLHENSGHDMDRRVEVANPLLASISCSPACQRSGQQSEGNLTITYCYSPQHTHSKDVFL